MKRKKQLDQITADGQAAPNFDLFDNFTFQEIRFQNIFTSTIIP